ncbi:uncharacterized [Tachysurus ichikawai]
MTAFILTSVSKADGCKGGERRMRHSGPHNRLGCQPNERFAVRTLAIKVNRPAQAFTAASVFTEPLLRHPVRPESPALGVRQHPQRKFVPSSCPDDPRPHACMRCIKKKKKKKCVERAA